MPREHTKRMRFMDYELIAALNGILAFECEGKIQINW